MNRPLIAHVEAGLRSGDRSMPEEINRILTDALSDILFVTEEDAIGNLVREGIPQDKVFFVGNVMIDTLHDHLIKARRSSIKQTLGVNGNRYGLVTLHRPSNVDAREALEPLVGCLNRISREVSLLFPMHPRTRVNLEKFGLMEDLLRSGSIKIIGPLGYLDFLNLLESATVVLTDSGGIQEETTALGVPCVTLRENTERPITVTSGTNYLVGTNHDEILKTITEILCGKAKKGRVPPLWDGDSGKRIIAALLKKTESILTKGTDSVQSNGNIFPEPNDSAYEPSDTKCP
jgi:UDP-N-acetylglucosamine 2-epimerase (non-hydrolysing)